MNTNDRSNTAGEARFVNDTAVLAADGALQRIDEAVQFIKDSDKAAYLEVKETAPDLIQKESNPVIFLQHSNNDATAAAKRLTMYWAWRKEFFKDNAYKPLNQTGSGALNQTDIEMLNTGGFALLPNHVIYFDRSRFSKAMIENPEGRLRCLFYIFSLAVAALYQRNNNRNNAKERVDSDSSSAAAAALVVLARLSSNESFGHSRDFYLSRKAIDLIQNCLPVTISEIHLVSLPQSEVQECMSIPRSAYRALMGSLAAICIQMIGNFFGPVITHHSGSTTKELFQKLKAHGFTKKGLPVCMGGSWSHESFQQFQRRQLRIEEELFLSDAEKLKRKREVNRIHSRQKRTRRRIEWEVLHDQCSDLQVRNEVLRQQNQELESLLKTAQREVELYEKGALGRHSSQMNNRRSQSGVPALAVQETHPSAALLQQHLDHQRALERLTQASLLQQQHQQLDPFSLSMASLLQSHSQNLSGLLSPPNFDQRPQASVSRAAALASATSGHHQLSSNPTSLHYPDGLGMHKIAGHPASDWLLLQQQQQQQQSAIRGYDSYSDGHTAMAGVMAQQLRRQQQESFEDNHQVPTDQFAALQHGLGGAAQRLPLPPIANLYDSQQQRLCRKEGDPSS